MPRLICGTNWFMGYSHQTLAKDRLIRDLFDTPQKIANVLEVFTRNGCNATMSMPNQLMADAIEETKQRTGTDVIWITTPGLADDSDFDSYRTAVDLAKSFGGTFCFPHQYVTDAHTLRAEQRLDDQLLNYLNYVREVGMIPGLSAHAPDAVVCADACGADVESYIQPYNSMGFLCQVESDWVQRVIQNAKKPVMTIKPLAAGRMLPVTGLTFVWNTIRDCDMVTIGTMSTYEAEEVIEISLACLEQRKAGVELQSTRSKKNLQQVDSVKMADGLWRALT